MLASVQSVRKCGDGASHPHSRQGCVYMPQGGGGGGVNLNQSIGVMKGDKLCYTRLGNFCSLERAITLLSIVRWGQVGAYAVCACTCRCWAPHAIPHRMRNCHLFVTAGLAYISAKGGVLTAGSGCDGGWGYTCVGCVELELLVCSTACN